MFIEPHKALVNDTVMHFFAHTNLNLNLGILGRRMSTCKIIC